VCSLCGGPQTIPVTRIPAERFRRLTARVGGLVGFIDRGESKRLRSGKMARVEPRSLICMAVSGDNPEHWPSRRLVAQRTVSGDAAATFDQTEQPRRFNQVAGRSSLAKKTPSTAPAPSQPPPAHPNPSRNQPPRPGCPADSHHASGPPKPPAQTHADTPRLLIQQRTRSTDTRRRTRTVRGLPPQPLPRRTPVGTCGLVGPRIRMPRPIPLGHGGRRGALPGTMGGAAPVSGGVPPRS